MNHATRAGHARQFRAGAAGLTVRGSGVLQGFSLTERPNRWAYAEAQIEGDRVIVTQPKLKAPVALRYDWVVEAGHEGNLTDASGRTSSGKPLPSKSMVRTIAVCGVFAAAA